MALEVPDHVTCKLAKNLEKLTDTTLRSLGRLQNCHYSHKYRVTNAKMKHSLTNLTYVKNHHSFQQHWNFGLKRSWWIISWQTFYCLYVSIAHLKHRSGDSPVKSTRKSRNFMVVTEGVLALSDAKLCIKCRRESYVIKAGARKLAYQKDMWCRKARK